MWCKLLILLTFLSWPKDVQSKDNGLGKTPAMGWISWTGYRFRSCDAQEDNCINERMIKEAADLFVSEGYKDAGYEYIIIDGPWRQIGSEIKSDSRKFPNGIKYLVDYVHSKGLKFGIQHSKSSSDPKLEAKTFAKWGLDYVKLNGESGYSESYAKLLNETGRPMALACSWPYYDKGSVDFEKVKDMCNSWRYHSNIHESYESVRDIIDEFGDIQDEIQPHAGPGHFNNPDMLMIGNSGLSIHQSRTQMAIWAILAAPLMMSNNLKKTSPEAKKILLNKQIIAVNQDSLGIQGKRVMSDAKNEVWIRPIQPVCNGSYSYAIALSSKHESNPPTTISVNLTNFDLNYPGVYHVVNLFNGETSEFQTNGKNFSAFVMPSGVAFFKFTPGYIFKYIVHDSAESKSSDSSLIFWFFVVFFFVLFGVGITFIHAKKEALGIKYEHFTGNRSRLAFWR